MLAKKFRNDEKIESRRCERKDKKDVQNIGVKTLSLTTT